LQQGASQIDLARVRVDDDRRGVRDGHPCAVYASVSLPWAMRSCTHRTCRAS
jgi:hypothetical protein